MLNENHNTTIKPLYDLDGEPVFNEPWHAQALAIADSLVTSGKVTPEEWSNALGAQLEHARHTAAPDTPQTYYQSVLDTLEALVVNNLPLSKQQLENRTQQWKDAYLSTPHGSPVSLK